MTTCADCDNTGVRYVQEAWAVQEAARLSDKQAEPLTPEWDERYRVNLEVARRFCFPCRTCRPVQFVRWAGGHFDSGHDRDRCPECIAAATSGSTTSRRARKPRAPEAPPPPGDEQAPPEPDYAQRAAGDT